MDYLFMAAVLSITAIIIYFLDWFNKRLTQKNRRKTFVSTYQSSSEAERKWIEDYRNIMRKVEWEERREHHVKKETN